MLTVSLTQNRCLIFLTNHNNKRKDFLKKKKQRNRLNVMIRHLYPKYTIECCFISRPLRRIILKTDRKLLYSVFRKFNCIISHN